MTVYMGMLISYISGSLIYIFSGFGFAALFSLCFLLVNLVLFKKVRPRMVVYSVSLLLGVFLLSGASEPTASEFDNYLDRYIEIEGVISEVPDERRDHFSYVLNAEKIYYLQNTENISERIRVNYEQELYVGNKVKFRGYLSEIMPPDNSNEFDYKRYYRSKGIFYTLNAEEAEVVKIRSFIFSPRYWMEYIKGNISIIIDNHYKNDDAAIIKAVLLGVKTEFSDDLNDALVKTSAMRFLHPSFLQLFLFLAFIGFISRKLTYAWKTRILITALILFCLLNGNSVTFLRAGVFALVTLVYRKVRGFSDFQTVFSITVLGCLLSNPLLFYNACFVMSLTVGLLIHYFRRPVYLKLSFIKNKRLRSYTTLWIITTVGLIPLGGYFFGGMPLYSIIFTFTYLPIVLLVFFLSPITLLTYSLFGLDRSFGVLLNGMIDLLKAIPEIVSYLPWHYVVIPKTTILGFVTFILFICLVRELLYDDTDKLKIKLFSIPLSIIILFTTFTNLLDIGKMYVTFINVGQGDAAMIEVKGHNTVLIDGGGQTTDSDYDIGKEVYLPYITAKGKDKIDLAIVSHYHSDHIDGILEAVKNLRVHTLMMPYTPMDIKAKEKLIEAAKSSGTEIIEALSGDKIEFDSGLLIEVLSPDKRPARDENDLSLVLKISYGETEILFTGDITDAVEEKLKGKIGNCDILKVPHHGSKYSSTKEFIEEISPEFSVISAGRNNMYGHPADRVLTELNSVGSRILRTDYMCDITLECSRDGKIGARWYGEVLKWQ